MRHVKRKSQLGLSLLCLAAIGGFAAQSGIVSSDGINTQRASLMAKKMTSVASTEVKKILHQGKATGFKPRSSNIAGL